MHRNLPTVYVESPLNKGWYDMREHTRRVASNDQSRTPRPRDLDDTILAALARDDKLRLVFLRRRWQRLSCADQRQMTSSSGPSRRARNVHAARSCSSSDSVNNSATTSSSNVMRKV
jgi:hypothetical protein